MDRKNDIAVETITVRWRLSIGFPTAEVADSFEIEASASEEEVEEAIREAALEQIPQSKGPIP